MTIQRFTRIAIPFVALACLIVFPLFTLPLSANVDQDKSKSDAAQIETILKEQSFAWNNANIDGFMTAYWNSPDLTFSSGGHVERGWTNTRDRYKSRYPDKKTMGTLTFSNLETRILDNNAALTLGEWHLERDQPVGGKFTLVWQRFSDGWKIVHDHTSVNPKVETK